MDHETEQLFDEFTEVGNIEQQNFLIGVNSNGMQKIFALEV